MADETVNIVIHLKPEEKEKLARLCKIAQGQGVIAPDPNGDRPNYTAFTNLAWTMLEDYLQEHRRKREL